MKLSSWLGILILLGSCSASSPTPRRQSLSASIRLSPGMTMDQARFVMGTPNKTEIWKQVEEWHYCTEGSCEYEGCHAVDQFVALFFHKQTLVASTEYSVSPLDTDGQKDSCENSIKMGDYLEPYQVTELRLR